MWDFSQPAVTFDNSAYTFDGGEPSGGGGDSTPDNFVLPDISGVGRSTTVVSDPPVPIVGLTAAATITVANGEYSINGGAFTSSPGSITNGQTVRVRHTSSPSYNTTVNTVLTVGGVADTFSSTTEVDPATLAGDVNVTASAVVPGTPCLVTAVYAAAAITAGRSVAVNTAGQLVLADADSPQDVIGISLANAAPGQPCPVAIEGRVTLPAALVRGRIYVVSRTAGGIAPIDDVTAGANVTQLGVALDQSTLLVRVRVIGVAATAVT
jgi:hypothetical protein